MSTSSAPCLHRDERTNKRCWNNCVRGTGYCEEHQRPAFFGSQWKKPKGWADTTRRIFMRDKGKCYVCGNVGSEIEHKVPQHLNGSDEDWNLGVICIPCHKKKTQKEAKEAKERYRKY